MLTLAFAFVADSQATAILGACFGLAKVSSESIGTLAYVARFTRTVSRAFLGTCGDIARETSPVLLADARSIHTRSVSTAVLGALLLAAVHSMEPLVAQTEGVLRVVLIAGTISGARIEALLGGAVESLVVTDAVTLPVGGVAISMTRAFVGTYSCAAVRSFVSRIALTEAAVDTETIIVAEVFACFVLTVVASPIRRALAGTVFHAGTSVGLTCRITCNP